MADSPSPAVPDPAAPRTGSSPAAPRGPVVKTVVSGIRATGRLHLGNYLGVLKRFAALSQDPSRRCFYFIADLHTLTTLKEAPAIRAHSPDIVLDMLAAGVRVRGADTPPGLAEMDGGVSGAGGSGGADGAALYFQSQVPAVCELAWYLSCLTPLGDLERMPTFKEKAEKHADDVNAGLFTYPVLMAADVLGPQAHLVPVGTDQQPHLELARELARRFNRMVDAPALVVPNALESGDRAAEEAKIIPGLVPADEQGRFAKMGKSESADRTIYLNDTPEVTRAKVLKAPTDPARVRKTDPGTPEKCAIWHLHTHLSSPETQAEVAHGCRTAGIGCGQCKGKLCDALETELAPFRARRALWAADGERVREITRAGAIAARAVVANTVATVAHHMGIDRG